MVGMIGDGGEGRQDRRVVLLILLLILLLRRSPVLYAVAPRRARWLRRRARDEAVRRVGSRRVCSRATAASMLRRDGLKGVVVATTSAR